MTDKLAELEAQIAHHNLVFEGYKVLAGMGGGQDPMKVLEAVTKEITSLRQDLATVNAATMDVVTENAKLKDEIWRLKTYYEDLAKSSTHKKPRTVYEIAKQVSEILHRNFSGTGTGPLIMDYVNAGVEIEAIILAFAQQAVEEKEREIERLHTALTRIKDYFTENGLSVEVYADLAHSISKDAISENQNLMKQVNRLQSEYDALVKKKHAHYDANQEYVTTLKSTVKVLVEALEEADKEILKRACAFAKEDWKFATGINEALEVFRRTTNKAITAYKEKHGEGV
jgi:DNA repair exonuclease SbcCD ATPase subunit